MPQLRPEQLSAHLAQPLAALYVLHGNEPLLVAEAGDAVRAAARTQGYTEREVLVAGPTFKWDDLHLAAGNLSLFGERKVIDLRIPNGKPGREGTGALARYCGRLGADILKSAGIKLSPIGGRGESGWWWGIWFGWPSVRHKG